MEITMKSPGIHQNQMPRSPVIGTGLLVTPLAGVSPTAKVARWFPPANLECGRSRNKNYLGAASHLVNGFYGLYHQLHVNYPQLYMTYVLVLRGMHIQVLCRTNLPNDISHSLC